MGWLECRRQWANKRLERGVVRGGRATGGLAGSKQGHRQRSVRHGLQRRCPHLAEVYCGILVVIHLSNHGAAHGEKRSKKPAL